MIDMINSVIVLCLLEVVRSHVVISYPGWRGNNLQLNGSIEDTGGLGTGTVDGSNVYPYGMQWIYPCGGMPISSNRTQWPIDGGAVAFQPGWFSGHEHALIYVNLGLGSLPENYSQPLLKQPLQLVGPSNNPYPGTVCLPQISLSSAGLDAVKVGDNATIQIVEAAVHGAALYSCVDITFVETLDAEHAVNASNCFNSTDIKFASDDKQQASCNATTTSSAVPATTSTPSTMTPATNFTTATSATSATAVTTVVTAGGSAIVMVPGLGEIVWFWITRISSSGISYIKESTMSPQPVDVLIFGAGPAGLAAAGGLARQLHTAIVFNSSQFRNARAKHMHNVLGWDHRPPSEFRAKSRTDILARYSTIEFRDVEIIQVKRLDDNDTARFEATDSVGEKYLGMAVVLATGVKDIMPDIAGFAELWGTGIFHCLFCHGYEERGNPSAGVLMIGPMANKTQAPAIARMAARLAGQINVYTNGGPDFGAEVQQLLKLGTERFHIENRRILKFEKDPTVAGDAGVLVTLEDGTVNREGFVVHAPEARQASTLPSQLGVQMDEAHGHVQTVAPFNSTSVPGVFAAGDCATYVKAVPAAIAMGGMAAVGIAHSLQADGE